MRCAGEGTRCLLLGAGLAGKPLGAPGKAIFPHRVHFFLYDPRRRLYTFYSEVPYDNSCLLEVAS
jgi:hypothetical protein